VDEVKGGLIAIFFLKDRVGVTGLCAPTARARQTAFSASLPTLALAAPAARYAT
jgi:hypothetical protein